MINYINFITVLEWCTFLASLALLDKRTARWRLFIALLALSIGAELAGGYMYFQLNITHNALPYNCLTLVNIGFLIWFLAGARWLQPIRRLLLFCLGAFLVFGVGNFVFLQGINQINSYTEALGDIMLAIICCYFLFKLVTDSEDINLMRLDYFWLTIGVLFYSLGAALLFQFANLLERYYLQTKINAGNYINYTLCFILYTCLTIAFICRRKSTRLL